MCDDKFRYLSVPPRILPPWEVSLLSPRIGDTVEITRGRDSGRRGSVVVSYCLSFSYPIVLCNYRLYFIFAYFFQNLLGSRDIIVRLPGEAESLYRNSQVVVIRGNV